MVGDAGVSFRGEEELSLKVCRPGYLLQRTPGLWNALQVCVIFVSDRMFGDKQRTWMEESNDGNDFCLP